jgi:hypothetical protein
MQTHCSPNQFSFQAFAGRSVSSSFDGGHITSDSGGLLLRESEEGQRFIQRFSQCFRDLRNPKFMICFEPIPSWLFFVARRIWKARPEGICEIAASLWREKYAQPQDHR